jgi:regulator of protease activity HflC (stomatin/prohibitin superfamily)
VTALLIALAVIISMLAALAVSAIRILREYERGVVFRLGRLVGPKGPGLVLLVPIIDRMVRVDLRTMVLDIPPQDLITRDNVPAKVNAVTYFRVIDAPSSVVEVERYLTATSQIAQTTLRSVLGKADLDMLLSERERLNEALQQIIDEQTDPWGVKVTAVEIKDVGIPPAMQRAMARQAEAERERRAKVIHAEGEYQASERLRDAADNLRPNPDALQLRYLQTLTEIGNNDSSTIVFALPLDVIRPLLDHDRPTPTAAGITRSDADAGGPPRVEEQGRSERLPAAEETNHESGVTAARRNSPPPAARGTASAPLRHAGPTAPRGPAGSTT